MKNRLKDHGEKIRMLTAVSDYIRYSQDNPMAAEFLVQIRFEFDQIYQIVKKMVDKYFAEEHGNWCDYCGQSWDTHDCHIGQLAKILGLDP